MMKGWITLVFAIAGLFTVDAIGSEPASKIAAADLRLSISASTNTVTVGGSVLYTVTVCNDGPDTAFTPSISRSFPGGTLVSTTVSVRVNCGNGQTSTLGTQLETGFGVTFTDTIRADAVGALSYRSFTGGFNLPDPNAQNNDVTVQTPVTPEPLPVTVFQAAGPNAASIQAAVDQFRLNLGANNGNGPAQPSGRREINWDGGGSTATSPGGTPFDVFLNSRGGRFTTPGTGFVQVPVANVADFFANPNYSGEFSFFSPVRLFSPVGSSVTEAEFFVPGGGLIPASTNAFGVVFTDVDLPDGSGPGGKRGNRHSSTLLEFFDASGNLIYSGFAPASPGRGSLGFVGIITDAARIARVKITAGDTPGVDDDRKNDIVLMDDFIYGEPQPIQ